MTPVAIIRQATAEGMTLTLTDSGGIHYTGDVAVVNRWLPLIRENKPNIVAALATEQGSPLDPDSVRAIDEYKSRWRVPCYVCGGVLFWHRKGGPLVCCTCHPPADEGIVYRRVRFEYVN